jgi:thiol-disulfide isomerase/thioredoxin
MEQEMRGFNPADTARGMELGMKYNQRTNDIKTFVRSFIDKNPKSPASYLAIGYLNWQTDMPYFKKVEAALKASMPGSEYQNYITSQISQIEYQQQQAAEGQRQVDLKTDELRQKYQKGSTPPEIKYPNPEGKIIPLSSLKGKYVLIDFWASWCRPCRAENPNVVRLYEKYKDKGFTVYSVSLDKEKAAWVNAIKQDNLVWPNHVSELMFWNSSVVKDYGFDGIPFTMLLDKEGKIIDVGLRGNQLEETLKKLIGS